MHIVLDHLAVAGESLAEATACIEDALGVKMQPGGKHPVFGTHNTLLGLADGLYLEAIAADPAAPEIGRARWFDLDRFKGTSRLSNWICATSDLSRTLAEVGPGAGQPVALSRGDLRWQMAVPENGQLSFDNLHPALIEWDSPVHPSTVLADSGCRLQRLVVTHPEAAELERMLKVVFSDQRVVLESGKPELRAEFDTPHGRRILQ